MVLALVLLAGCGSPPTDATDEAGATDATSEVPASELPASERPPRPSAPSATPTDREHGPGTEIITADSDFGPMLYDASGQPIYLFTAETGGRPGCYDDCAAAWPPVLTTGEPSGAGDVRTGLLGTIRRADGSTQVTYAGHPLYFYAHEGKYQVLCHDVEDFGGTWLVVRPDGTAAPA